MSGTSGIPEQFSTDAFVSLVVPVRDAAGFVENALRELDPLVRSHFRHYEIVLVDDNSRDDTVRIVERLQSDLKNLQLYCLSRRNGLDVALVAGLDNCIGDYAITLNLETDPLFLVETLWNETRHGAEFVCGVRSGRPTVLARLFCRGFERATGIPLPTGMTWARLYSRRVLNYIVQNNDRHLLLGVLPFFSSYGVQIVRYEPVQRPGGFGRISLIDSLIRGITTLLASSARPLRVVTLLAVMASSLSLLYAAYILGVALMKQQVVEGWISLALPMAVMFFFFSTILCILSEYIYMLSQQSGNRPAYSIRRESRSSVLEIQQRLNVQDEGGNPTKKPH